MTNRFVAFLVDNYFFFLFFSTDSRHHELREDSLLERATSSMEVQNTNLMMVQSVCEGINIIILNLVSVCVHKYCIRWLFAVSFTNICPNAINFPSISGF